MKKIFKSLFILGLVTVSVYGVSKSGAWFTDTEEVLGNSIDTGTIDIAVDDTNPWTRTYPYSLEDMKPSQHFYIDFTVDNVGTNPLNLYKTLSNYAFSDVARSEPEDVAEVGSGPVMDIDTQINYDMRVELYNDQDVLVWWETIYLDADNVRLDTLEGNRMYLGMVPVGWYMKVMQSYHMVDTAGNEYQGDAMDFNMTLDAEQLGMSSLLLENKEVVDGDLSHTILGDSKYATLSYTVRDRAFDYILDVYGMTTDGDYTLVSYADPWGSSTIALANVTVTSGDGHVEGSIDLNQDLINRKTWLVPGTFVPGTNIGAPPWNPSQTLFETGLMDYYDADIY